jgi:hypothetical protein
MARRYRSKARAFPVDAAFAGAAACVTLWYRLPLLALSSLGEDVERRMETARMVEEKLAAMVEGSLRANVEVMRVAGAAATGRLQPQDIAAAAASIAAAGLQPSFRRVRANAKRLNRRAIRRLTE